MSSSVEPLDHRLGAQYGRLSVCSVCGVIVYILHVSRDHIPGVAFGERCLERPIGLALNDITYPVTGYGEYIS